MKRSELKQIIREEIQKLNEGSDWILLPSIDKMVDEYRGFFMDKVNPMFSDEIQYGSIEWKKLYKKLSSKDKKTVDWLKKENQWDRQFAHKGLF